MKPTREEAGAAVLNLLSHITSPTDEQVALMKYVRGIIDEPYTEANRQIIEDCLGRTLMLIKEKSDAD